MKQTIEIEVPDSKQAIWKDNKVVFKDIKPKLPKTWEEFCKQNKTNDRNILLNKQAAEQHFALMKLHQLRDCYRQGWIPDCDDEKFIITVNYKEFYSVGKCIKTKEFLAFQSREIAEEFLTNFRDLIEQAGDLI